ncbi:MAG: hypothetical protein A2992_01845 [Elusimicrobia bacterium RIFCSPLOWO2_01_FULL_59_12]|nr:MAG: hypothetical protein A2992_01845 [Elusimicrobia bacterium RIFCSPLOWO2_01_FULL_59_12]
MLLIIVGLVMGLWMLAMGWKFYHSVDWDEAPEPSPDLQAMHKREAQLLHIQEILEEACRQGKLSKAVTEEFNRYCASETEAMRSVETAWKNRKRRLGRTPGGPSL